MVKVREVAECRYCGVIIIEISQVCVKCAEHIARREREHRRKLIVRLK